MVRAWEPVTAYVADMSYFSGKLESYLRYKEIPFERRVVDVRTMIDEVYEHTGLMKVPVVRCADGQWLRDTTPMLQWFEDRYPRAPIVPRDPATAFVSYLVEDFADEWCWRAALYWRWMFPDTASLLGKRIGREVMADWPLPVGVAAWYYGWRQRREYLHGDGLAAHTDDAIRESYRTLLRGLNARLEHAPFLLGSHPSLVDFGFMGPMFRHYALDPAPAKVMRDEAPAVYEWVARMWNTRCSRLGEPSWGDFGGDGWSHLLREVVQIYWPWMLANARAWQRQHKRFDCTLGGVQYRGLKVVHYRVYCLEMLQRRFAALDNAARAKVRGWTEPHGAMRIDSPIDSGLRTEFELPLPPRTRAVTWAERLKLTLTGTPWDLPRPFSGAGPSRRPDL